MRVYEQWLHYKSGLSMMMMCWNCGMMEEISIQFVRLDYFSNVCACTRLTRLQLYKTKYVLRIAVMRSNPVPDIILSLVVESNLLQPMEDESVMLSRPIRADKFLGSDPSHQVRRVGGS